jgi:hypothetical protein
LLVEVAAHLETNERLTPLIVLGFPTAWRVPKVILHNHLHPPTNNANADDKLNTKRKPSWLQQGVEEEERDFIILHS